MPQFADIAYNEYAQKFDAASTFANYTKKDWSRWDSFEPRFAAYCPNENTKSLTDDQLKCFFSNFQNRLAKQFFPIAWQYFAGMLRGGANADPIHLLSYNSKDILMYGGMALNYAYNKYKTETTSHNKNTDDIDQIDWLKLPTVQNTATYIEKYLNLLLAFQNFDHSTISSSRGTFDTFGCFKFQNNWTYADPNLHFWYCSELFTIASHFMHLFSVDTIKTIRKSTMASMSCLYSWLSETGDDWQTSTAQWITRFTGFSVMASCLIQSENNLRRLSQWNTSFEIKQSDKVNGLWTNTDATDYTVYLINKFINWTNSNGLMEYCSVYYGFSAEQLSLAIVHAPNQQIHDLFQYIYYIHWYDLLNNSMLSSSSLSGPTNRSYSLLMNQGSQLDGLETKLFINTVFDDSCYTNLQQQYGTLSICNKYNGSDGNALNLNRYIHFTRIASNRGFIPFKTIRELFLEQPNKISISKFCNGSLQDRYNFISPFYQIGNSGLDCWHTPDNVLFNVRLPGCPTLPKGCNQSWSTLPMIRFYLTNWNSCMFQIPPGSVQMTMNNYETRQICAQHQGFSLVTHLIDYPDNFSSTDPFSTTILLPIFLTNGSISCNGMSLPLTLNTSMCLPQNCLITIIQNQTIVGIKILASSYESNVPDCPETIQQNTDLSCMTDKTNQPGHIMFQIDKDSYANGLAKLILVHRNPLNSEKITQSKAPFRQSYFFGCGRFTDGPSAQKLFWNLKNVKFDQSVLDFTDQRLYGHGGQKGTGKLWTSTVQYGNENAQNLKLQVVRGDFKSKHQLDFRNGIGSTFQPPWVSTAVQRLVNGKDVVSQFLQTGPAMKHAKVNFNDVFEPHLIQPTKFTDTPNTNFNISQIKDFSTFNNDCL